MKQYVLVNNKEEMDKLLIHYKKLSWRANLTGLKARAIEQKNYPFAVGFCDDYSWYMNDHGNDTNKYISIAEAIHESQLTVQKKIYIPYYTRMVSSFGGGRFTMNGLLESHKKGKLTSSSNAVRYVEKYQKRVSGAYFGGFSSWRHLHCTLNSFKVKNFSTITSYQEVGNLNFIGSTRQSNRMSEDFWEIDINISNEYNDSPDDCVLEKYLEITDFNTVDSNSGTHPQVRLGCENEIKPSYYIYYCLF